MNANELPAAFIRRMKHQLSDGRPLRTVTGTKKHMVSGATFSRMPETFLFRWNRSPGPLKASTPLPQNIRAVMYCMKPVPTTFRNPVPWP